MMSNLRHHKALSYHKRTSARKFGYEPKSQALVIDDIERSQDEGEGPEPNLLPRRTANKQKAPSNIQTMSNKQ